MASVCFYFQVHQPFRLRRYSVFDSEPNYFDDYKNAEICRKVAARCYLPANRLMLELIQRYGKSFSVSYSVTGVALEQMQRWSPEVIDSFRALVDTGQVELLAETYYHSLAFLYSREEFRDQIVAHSAKISETFGVRPKVFRNTELIYNNDLAHFVQGMGYIGILAEGADHILGYRSPSFVYRPIGADRIALLLKNYRLSDDIAFRFSDRNWSEWPLKAEKFAEWVNQVNGNGYLVNLFMDYETFGEHQWPETGIFQFLEHLPKETARHPNLAYALPREVAAKHEAVDTLEVPQAISWADTERDVSAWLHNKMQHHCFQQLGEIGNLVRQARNQEMTTAWRRLQTSDHLYYCSTKSLDDQNIHAYFSPYASPYLAFINYKNALDDLQAKGERLVRA